MTANRPLKGQTFYTINAFWCTLVRLSQTHPHLRAPPVVQPGKPSCAWVNLCALR